MYQPKVILIVMDGWGYSPINDGNAISLAKKPNFDYLWANFPHALIEAAGEPVGLPWGSTGSSEVGHICLGSGRIINQDLPRVSKAISSGELFRNFVLLAALSHARKYKSNLHLLGLVSAGGVHSHIDHLFALLALLHKYHFKEPSFVQMITDGRDAPIKAAPMYVDKVLQRIQSFRLNTQIASIVGRYFAMDRDSHWERTQAAYNLLVLGMGEKALSPKEAIYKAYGKSQTDEFIEPTVILKTENPSFWDKTFKKKSSQSQVPTGLIKDNDAVIFFNFRPERMRQLVETFVFPQQNFPKKVLLKNMFYASIVEYEKSLPIYTALPPEKIENSLAKIISDQNLSQLHISETEKYAHSTYFFDGGNPVPCRNEEWVVIPSPRVATYDKKPEMSAEKITDKILELANAKKYDFIMVNFANVDMVGHTGNLEAAKKAVEVVDRQLGRLTKAFGESIFLITADHGNAEKMVNPQTGEIDTEHSISPVPFIIVGPQYKNNSAAESDTKPIGILADIAPTVLDILKIQEPPEMTGYSLLKSLI